MPYHLSDEQSDCDGWAVVKTETGETVPGGCHASKAEAQDHLTALNLSETYQRAVDLSVPEYVQSAAAKGLELRAEGFGGDGLVERTIREARAMANGEITADKVVRANAWGARHAVDLEAPSNSDPDDDGWPGAGAVAHYLWGINPLDPEPARAWFERKAEAVQMDESKMADSTEVFSETVDVEASALGIVDAVNTLEIVEADSEIITAVQRDNLVRHVEFRAQPSDDGLTLDGYAAVFNQDTQIETADGVFTERIAPGAFRKTLQERMPVLQFDHGTHPLLGSMPLGVITSLKEDDHGLRVKARLSDNWLIQPVRDAIRDGAIDGMSFRFRVINDKWSRAADIGLARTITEIALYEVGPVVFPAYEQTSVGVRSREIVTALTDPELRAELARALASGTSSLELAASEMSDESNDVHSARSKNQRRALARLTLGEFSHEA